MRTFPPAVAQQLKRREDDFVKLASEIAKELGSQDKERQLRNIQSIAEGSDSWAALELFIRYQAARGELKKDWAEETIRRLAGQQRLAREIAGAANSDLEKTVHMEVVSRVLGYAVRWHVWETKGKEQNKAEEAKR